MEVNQNLLMAEKTVCHRTLYFTCTCSWDQARVGKSSVKSSHSNEVMLESAGSNRRENFALFHSSSLFMALQFDDKYEASRKIKGKSYRLLRYRIDCYCAKYTRSGA